MHTPLAWLSGWVHQPRSRSPLVAIGSDTQTSSTSISHSSGSCRGWPCRPHPTPARLKVTGPRQPPQPIAEPRPVLQSGADQSPWLTLAEMPWSLMKQVVPAVGTKALPGVGTNKEIHLFLIDYFGEDVWGACIFYGDIPNWNSSTAKRSLEKICPGQREVQRFIFV